VARGVAGEAAGDRGWAGGQREKTRIESLCKGGVGRVERKQRGRGPVTASIGECLEKHFVLLEDSLLEGREGMHESCKSRKVKSRSVIDLSCHWRYMSVY